MFSSRQNSLFGVGLISTMLVVVFVATMPEYVQGQNGGFKKDTLEKFMNGILSKKHTVTIPKRVQKLLNAVQEVQEEFKDLPQQIWSLPLRFGFYPGLQRTQEEIPQLVDFPCSRVHSTRSKQLNVTKELNETRAFNTTQKKTISVHTLRPGDIKVIAALGDSLTSANGALANNEEETRHNYRGVSAMGGGKGTWRKYLTLPNILKEFNPRLHGYALGPVETSSPLAGLNLAENGALDDELLRQARYLVSKIRKDPFIDIKNDWKIVNILIGGNDICNEYCYVDSDKDSPSGHRRQLEQALDFLLKNLPRTFVNLIHVPNVAQLQHMENVPFVCYAKQLVLCSCLFGGSERAKSESVTKMLQGYWQAEREVAEDPKYDTDDFTVVLQPFFLGVETPVSVNTWFGEAPDLSMFAPDCFHFSQKGNAHVANALWNNMLEPVGKKRFGWDALMKRFHCPTPEAPYFFTRRNSKTFLETGHQ